MALSTNQDGKNVNVVAPDYLYHYPCFRKVKLSAVKHQILHPDLPSIRRLERDTMLSKLPDEHCRTTTSCGPRDFALASMNVLPNATKQLHCMGCTERGRNLSKKYYTPLDVMCQGLIWHKYIDNPMVAQIMKRRENPLVEPRPIRGRNCGCIDAKNIQFDGIPLRYTKSHLRNWRFSFKCEPRVVEGIQQPVPSDVEFPREVKRHPKSVRCSYNYK